MDACYFCHGVFLLFCLMYICLIFFIFLSLPLSFTPADPEWNPHGEKTKRRQLKPISTRRVVGGAFHGRSLSRKIFFFTLTFSLSLSLSISLSLSLSLSPAGRRCCPKACSRAGRRCCCAKGRRRQRRRASGEQGCVRGSCCAAFFFLLDASVSLVFFIFFLPLLLVLLLLYAQRPLPLVPCFSEFVPMCAREWGFFLSTLYSPFF